MAAIPTRYNGVQFRSRIEAKWAAMFDLLGWRWEYEPIDLDGYIPDFVLVFPAGGVLVEVKSIFGVDDLIAAAAKKIDASGWQTTNTNSALILGAAWDAVAMNQPFRLDDDGTWVTRTFGNNDPTDSLWDAAEWHECARCPRPTLCHQTGMYLCVVCGHYDGHCGGWFDHQISDMWAEAGNTVQWRAPR